MGEMQTDAGLLAEYNVGSASARRKVLGGQPRRK
jgi:hypothetical protein